MNVVRGHATCLSEVRKLLSYPKPSHTLCFGIRNYGSVDFVFDFHTQKPLNRICDLVVIHHGMVIRAQQN